MLHSCQNHTTLIQEHAEGSRSCRLPLLGHVTVHVYCQLKVRREEVFRVGELELELGEPHLFHSLRYVGANEPVPYWTI
jgi:hypothetical protein